MTEENNKKKSIFYYILKKIKISHIVILIVLLAANSYAWFIYVNTVSSSVDVHIRSWKINLHDGEDEIVDYVDFDVSNVFPGMTDYERTLDIYNYGDVDANVSYSILEATILGTHYKTQEGKMDDGEPYTNSDLTSDELEDQLANDYPFTISFGLTGTSISPNNGYVTYSLDVVWPYESGNDSLDTYWGTQAYSFKNTNPSSPCITIRIKIVISQASVS